MTSTKGFKQPDVSPCRHMITFKSHRFWCLVIDNKWILGGGDEACRKTAVLQCRSFLHLSSLYSADVVQYNNAFVDDNIKSTYYIQGDTSGCLKPPVDLVAQLNLLSYLYLPCATLKMTSTKGFKQPDVSPCRHMITFKSHRFWCLVIDNKWILGGGDEACRKTAVLQYCRFPGPRGLSTVKGLINRSNSVMKWSHFFIVMVRTEDGHGVSTTGWLSRVVRMVINLVINIHSNRSYCYIGPDLSVCSRA